MTNLEYTIHNHMQKLNKDASKKQVKDSFNVNSSLFDTAWNNMRGSNRIAKTHSKKFVLRDSNHGRQRSLECALV